VEQGKAVASLLHQNYELTLQKNHELWQAEHSSKAWQLIKPMSAQLLHANIGYLCLDSVNMAYRN
jgi:hypothetical protein